MENGPSGTPEAVVETCLVCMEPSEFWGVGECGHSEICAKCHFRLRSKQQNLHCSLCKQINTTLLIVKTEQRAEYTGPGANRLSSPGDFVEYSTASVHFISTIALREFELHIAAECPACKEKFVHPETYKMHLAQEHRLYLCEVCVVQRPVLLSQQRVYNRLELARHLQEGEIDPECDQLLMYHPQCQVADSVT